VGFTLFLKLLTLYVVKKYEPLDHKETENANSQWRFIQQTFQLVLNSKFSQIKIFLLLALISREPELASEVEKLCKKKKFKTVFPVIQQLVEGVVMSAFNRTNIGYRIQFFLFQLTALCSMNIIPGIGEMEADTPKDAEPQLPDLGLEDPFGDFDES